MHRSNSRVDGVGQGYDNNSSVYYGVKANCGFSIPVRFSISESLSLSRPTCVSMTAGIEGQLWILIPVPFSISEHLESGSWSLYSHTSKKRPQPCYMPIQPRISQNECRADYMAHFAVSYCLPIRDGHRSGFHSAVKHTNPACFPGNSAATS